jgi:MFS family permease
MQQATSPSARVGVSTSVATRRAPAFALLASVQFVLILAISVLNVVFPDIQRDFDLKKADLALLNAAYGMSFSGLLLLGGRFSDLYGARRIFVSGTAVFGLSSAVAGLAPDAWVLLAARFVQGAGAAFAVPAAMALVSVVYPEPARHARMMAFWGGLAAFGGTAGMLLSGVVATWNWRWALVVPVLVAVSAVVMARRLLPSGPAPRTGRLDLPGAVLLTAGISLLGYGFGQASVYGWAAKITVGSLAGGAVLLLVALLVESRVRNPILPLLFLASARRAAALLAVFLAATGITTVFFLLPLYFQQVRGYSAIGASAAFVPFGAALVVTGLSTGRLVHRFGPRVVTSAGLVIAAVGLGLLSRIDIHTPYANVILAGLLFFSIGSSLVFSGATVAATADVPREQAGLAGAVVNSAMETGPAVGLVILVTLAIAHTGTVDVGQAAAQTSGYSFALTIAAAAFAVVALAAAFLLRPQRRIRTEN